MAGPYVLDARLGWSKSDQLGTAQYMLPARCDIITFFSMSIWDLGQRTSLSLGENAIQNLEKLTTNHGFG